MDRIGQQWTGVCRVLVTVVVTGVTPPYSREKEDEMVLVLAPVARGDESAGWTAFVPREPRRLGDLIDGACGVFL